MGEDRSEELQDHHNKGQADGFANVYDPPHSVTLFDEAIYPEYLIEQMREDNEAYDTGWRHGYDQR